MKTKLCDLNRAAAEKLPQFTGDKSGVGVHYIDAYIKPMNTKLPDGTAVSASGAGLKVVLTAGSEQRRRTDAAPRRKPRSIVMLDAALQEAARTQVWNLPWKTERFS